VTRCGGESNHGRACDLQDGKNSYQGAIMSAKTTTTPTTNRQWAQGRAGPCVSKIFKRDAFQVTGWTMFPRHRGGSFWR